MALQFIATTAPTALKGKKYGIVPIASKRIDGKQLLFIMRLIIQYSTRLFSADDNVK